MDTIKDIWFDANRIYMKTDGGETFSRPLEAFPLLKDASDRERLDFKIGKFGDDVRWESLDEDIHISSFFDTAMGHRTKRFFQWSGKMGERF